jgi:hypothetical protein
MNVCPDCLAENLEIIYFLIRISKFEIMSLAELGSYSQTYISFRSEPFLKRLASHPPRDQERNLGKLALLNELKM